MRTEQRELLISPEQRRYDALIGVGGIGTGVFFALDGNHTLGREESRGGRFLEGKDYCKLHIIAHYVQILLGPTFQTFPVGKLGDDQPGQQLLGEICQTGFDTRHLEVVRGGTTLYSFCFVYPDSSGGNLTTNNSVNATVDADFVDRAQPTFAAFDRRGIALAAPEVSLEARLRLLELGKVHGCFCVAALTSAEVRSVQAEKIVALADLLALNLDEAAAIAGEEVDSSDALRIVEAAVDQLRRRNSRLWISITAGRQGAWAWDGRSLSFRSAVETNVVSTAGAGDAFLAGLIVAITAGRSLVQAQELAALLAGLAVTSPHTIHPDVSRQSLAAFADSHSVPLCASIRELLETVHA